MRARTGSTGICGVDGVWDDDVGGGGVAATLEPAEVIEAMDPFVGIGGGNGGVTPCC